MNINELRQQPHLSISGITDYIDCGLLYRFSRVDKVIPEFKADVLAFGSSVHRTLQDFYQCRMEGYRMSFKEVRERFEHHWHESVSGKNYIRYGQDHNYDSMLQMGIVLLKTWYETPPDIEFRLIGVEEPFCFTIPGVPVPIIGAMDLVEEDESGIIVISDHKTPAKAMSNADVHANQQLTLYQMAAKSNGYGDRGIVLKFNCLIKTKTPKFEQYYTTRTQDAEHRLIRKIQSVWEGISKGVFVPNDLSWKCTNCAYQSACGSWFRRESE